jgi:hypothetical protein
MGRIASGHVRGGGCEPVLACAPRRPNPNPGGEGGGAGAVVGGKGAAGTAVGGRGANGAEGCRRARSRPKGGTTSGVALGALGRWLPHGIGVCIGVAGNPGRGSISQLEPFAPDRRHGCRPGGSKP